MARFLGKIRNTFLSRLWVQLWLGLAVLFLVVLTVLGFLLIRNSEEAVRTTLFRDHEEIALRAANEIGLFVQNPKEILASTAVLVGMSHTDVWKQETLLVELGLRHPIYTRLSSVSLEGKELASSQPETPPLDFSEDPAVLTALKGEFGLSAVKISPKGIPYMEMAAPYFNLGEIVGVLRATVSLRGVWDIVDQIKIGQTGFAYLVSNSGAVIAHEDKKMVLNHVDLTAQPFIQNVLQGKKGSVALTLEEGRKVLSAFAPVPEFNWGLVTQQQWDEAFAFAKRMRQDFLLMLLGSLLIASVVCIVFAMVFSSPIKKLAATAIEVAKGNFEVALSSRRIDEIGLLIHNFIDMIAKLKKAKEMERLTSMGLAAASIAHELRNPLVAVKTYTQLFSRKKNEPQFLDRFEKTIPPEIDRLGSLLDELSDFSRVNKVTLSPMTLFVTLEEVLGLLEERIKEKGVSFELTPSVEKEVKIMGDKEKLKQVFINLITNALQATEAGGKITVALLKENETLKVAIADTGKGIPPEERQNLFKPFHTFGKKKGLGLGLAICMNIVQQHQGGIEVESEVGKGTTFILSFPQLQLAQVAGSSPI